jgi:putative transposase
MSNRFRYQKTSAEIIRLAVMLYVRFPLARRQVEDILLERSIDISYETVRARWNRFAQLFAAESRKKRSAVTHGLPRDDRIWTIFSYASTAKFATYGELLTTKEKSSKHWSRRNPLARRRSSSTRKR